jgi:uncharacterized protein (TIGR03435 family)
LGGVFDFKIDWTPDSAMPLSRLVAGSDEAASAGDLRHPSIFTALTEQLGFRLEPKKGPVLVFVIEKIARPSEN